MLGIGHMAKNAPRIDAHPLICFGPMMVFSRIPIHLSRVGLALATVTLTSCIDYGHPCASGQCQNIEDTSAGPTTGSSDTDDNMSSGTENGSETEADTTATDTDTAHPPQYWPGVRCQDPKEEEAAAGQPKIYFDVDAGKEEGHDFYRLPFPNDLRVIGDGTINLEGFPVPPPEFTGEFGPLIERWVEAVADNNAFALNGTTLFRASHPFVFNHDAVHLPIYFVNVDPTSENYGKRHPTQFLGRNGSVSVGNFICANWIGVQTYEGYPLEPNTQYAVLLTNAITPANGGTFRRDDHLEILLSATPPNDGSLMWSWNRYANLRDFYASSENASGIQLKLSQTIGATVFTTSDAPSVMELAETTKPEPEHKSLYLCDAAGDSPCSTAPGLTPEERKARRCPVPNPNYYEFHGRASFEQYQEGTPPFSYAGGAIVDNKIKLIPQYREDVCYSLTIPRAVTMPDEGWPVVLFAHGTGGSFRDGVEFAEHAAARGLAMLSFEGFFHGERRHDTDDDGLVDGLSLDELVFNLRNPDAARDNLIQGAVDIKSGIRYIDVFNAPQTVKPGGYPLDLDPDNVFLFGHSQGAQQVALMFPFLSKHLTAILSGAGGNLPRSLVDKQLPTYDVPGSDVPLGPGKILELALMVRPDRELTTYHPVLALLNTHVNRSDPELYAHNIIADPFYQHVSGPKNILHYIGHVDPYTPLRTSSALAVAMGLRIADATLFTPPCDQYLDEAEQFLCHNTDSGVLKTVELPVVGNVPWQFGPPTTAAALMVQATQPNGGHSVIYQPQELHRVFDFLHSALDGQIPVLE